MCIRDSGIAMHNSYNACAALAVGHVLNLNLEELSLNLNNISYPARRMEIKNALNDALLIDDSYNANPESMKRSLDFLDSIKGKNRIFVAGEMGELGTHKESFHIDICNYAKHRVEEFLCIGGLWDEGIKGIPKIGSKFSSKDDLLDYLNTKLAKNSVILVKGSRSSRMDYISDKLSEKGIATNSYYSPPLHLQPVYKKLGLKRGSFPVSEELSKELICLPIYPSLSSQNQEYIKQTTEQYFWFHKRWKTKPDSHVSKNKNQ